MEEFPLDVYGFASVAGVAVFVGVVLQWVKKLLPDWRYTNLVGLALGEAAAVAAGVIIFGGKPGPDVIFSSLMIGFFGATVATFGYEGLLNILGALQFGPRSDRALNERAVSQVEAMMRKPH